jgi:hypothetical protein
VSGTTISAISVSMVMLNGIDRRSGFMTPIV